MASALTRPAPAASTSTSGMRSSECPMRKLLACLVALAFLIGLGWGPARAAVAFDACATSQITSALGTTGTNSNLTIGAGLTNSVLVVTLIVSGANVITAPAVTWNSVSMTQVASAAGGGSTQVYIF